MCTKTVFTTNTTVFFATNTTVFTTVFTTVAYTPTQGPKLDVLSVRARAARAALAAAG